jgi:hypothetical protein
MARHQFGVLVAVGVGVLLSAFVPTRARAQWEQAKLTASDVGNPNFDIAGLTIVYSSVPIPTLSGWGLMAIAAILLGAGLFVLRRHPGSPSLASLPPRGGLRATVVRPLAPLV